MIETARKLFDLLDGRERIRLALLFGAVLVMAFLQMVSIASVLPFLSVAANPAAIQTNYWLAWAYESLGFTSTNRFLVALGGFALLVLVLSNAWMAATHWAQFRFVRTRTHGLSTKLMAHYLAQPYVYFLRRNSADLGKNVLAEVDQVAERVLMPCLQLASRAIVALAIVGLLIALDPLLALLVTVVLGSAYGLIYLGVRRILGRLGAMRVETNTARYKAAAEAFGGIKDIKLLGKERAFLRRFRSPSQRLNQAIASAQIISELPRYALESLAFGGVGVVAIFLLVRDDGGLQQVVPTLGLYVFAGYRLLPSLQQIFGGLAKLRFGMPALETLHRELIGGGAGAAALGSVGNGHVCSALPLQLHHRLELENITFTYPSAHKPALENVSLTIPANATIGIMGPTGSGKTTLVDVLLGLLRPQQGTIRIDGTPLTEHNLSAWQGKLGYVPQHIYLADNTIAANIAFGMKSERIDMAAVERAARLAQIHDFITQELPEGYATIVGERGVRLSGGQRQRIGIARAQYHDPNLLIFDEATSALDSATENGVLGAVEALSGRKTLIMIAHRATSLHSCDVILEMKAGRLTLAALLQNTLSHSPPNSRAVTHTT